MIVELDVGGRSFALGDERHESEGQRDNTQ
jgi:hypothetical protein